MKKMLLTVIFIIVLALLVLAGCVSFSTNIPDLNDTTDDISSIEEPVTYEPATHYVPATDELGEDVTDAEGSQVYVPVTDEPSGVYETTAYDPGMQGQQNVPTTQGQQNVPTTQGQQNVPTTKAQQNVPTTKAQQNVPTTQGQQNVPTTQASVSAANEYDIFRSGTFYAKGQMKDEEGVNPLEMAITPDSIYMLTKFDNTNMAILVSSGKTYLIYPQGKAYLEMSSTVMNMMGLNTDDLISSDGLGFSDMEPLNKAQGTSKATLNGQNCTVYSFAKADGSTSKVYMNGNKLVGIEAYEGTRITSATYFDFITASVPADKINPDTSYKKTGIFDFMSMLGEVLE